MPVPTVDELPFVKEGFDFVRGLAQKAFTNDLTDLLNRAAYRMIADAYDRSPASQKAVAFIDLTGFKAINDTHSHEAGNAAPREAAMRLGRIASAINGEAFHMSGDEFLLLFETTRLEGFKEVFATELSTFQFEFKEQQIVVRANAGVALPEAERLLGPMGEQAELACRNAKTSGTKAPVIWTAEMEADALQESRHRCQGCSATIVLTVPRQALLHTALICPNCRSELSAVAAAPT